MISMATLELVALIVRDYEPAIRFFVNVLQFELVEDTPSLTNDGRPKRWVVVRPTGAQTGILLARADGEHQATALGQQFAGRVGLFLRVEDFDVSRHEWWRAVSVLSQRPASRLMANLLCFLTWNGTAGTCSVPTRGLIGVILTTTAFCAIDALRVPDVIFSVKRS